MKSYLIFGAFLFPLIIFAETSKLDAKLQDKIEAACTKSADKKSKKLCPCIAKTHFESAQKEPKPEMALKQLQWVIDYYQTKDKKKLKILSEKPENLVDFDFGVAEDCAAKN